MAPLREVLSFTAQVQRLAGRPVLYSWVSFGETSMIKTKTRCRVNCGGSWYGSVRLKCFDEASYSFSRSGWRSYTLGFRLVRSA